MAGIQASPTTLQPTPEPARLPIPEIQKEPEIIGTLEQIKAVRDALELLRVKDSKHYGWIIDPDYIKSISVTGVGDRASMNLIAKSVVLPPSSIVEGAARTASIIVHEATHSKSYSDWWKNNPNAVRMPDEMKNTIYGNNAEVVSMTEEIEALKLTGGDPKTIAALEKHMADLKNSAVIALPPLQPSGTK